MTEFVERLNEFGNTRNGKIVLVGLLAVMVLVIVYLANSYIFSKPVPKTMEVVDVSTSPGTSTPSEGESGAPGASGALSDGAVATLGNGLEAFGSDVLRNPFAEIVNEQDVVQDVGQEVETLMLQGVSFSDNMPGASVVVDGEVLALTPGDTAGPYMFLDAGADWAKFLYGDVTITLSVGESHTPR